MHLSLRLAAAAVAVGIAAVAQAAPLQVGKFIRVDQFGYLPDMRKVAIVADPQAGFDAAEAFAPGTGANQYQLRRWADDSVVLSGTLAVWNGGATHAQSGDRGWHFDFSAVTAPGSYYVWDVANRVGSGRFEIGTAVYDEVLRQAVRMFFYQRLGFAKLAPYADARWTDGAAFVDAYQDAQATSRTAKGNLATARDLRGGWMDAGDANKYVTFAQDTVIQLIDAWRANPAVFGDDYNLPESGNGLPDLLDEIKWELDFLKRMQDATGSNGLLLKVGVDTYDGEVTPPSADKRRRYYVAECTSATLAGSAMFASAGVALGGIASQAAYAADLVSRAEKAWTRAKSATASWTRYQTACDNGDIKSGDADVDAQGQLESAVLAAIALYEATGKAEYKSFVEARYTTVRPYSLGWWGPYWAPMQTALLRYAGLAGASAGVAGNIRNQKAAQNGVLSIDALAAGSDLYRAHVPTSDFSWGHNRTRANAGNLNLDFVAFNLNAGSAAQYSEVAQQHLHWLHGANPLGLVYLSHMADYGAEKSIDELYHAWFSDGSVWDNATSSPKGPPPGYLVGGPNPGYGGSVANIANQPPQKAYKDWNTGWPDNSWELSEPAIYYQAAYVALLGRIISANRDLQAPSAPGKPAASAVSGSGFKLSWAAATDDSGAVVYDVYDGATLLRAGIAGTSASFTGLTCGSSHALTVKARDAAGNVSAASASLTVTTAVCLSDATVIYADALASGWTDVSRNSTRDFALKLPVRSGSRAVRVSFAAPGGTLALRGPVLPLAVGATLRFSVYSSGAVPLRLWVQTADGSARLGGYAFTTTRNGWRDFALPLSTRGNPLARIQRVIFELDSTALTPVAAVAFDDIAVTY
ncbi:glycoside hydrolase family 9 protein [Derxia lacustris]|uniref:glycoside hydrolase family 9 protein n=1 Tax=Derxia lacustris TaxID=764842 RepID=UPI000A176CBD|nr:glycoside hydrolase family 9 protein [Derxia lacustris]